MSIPHGTPTGRTLSESASKSLLAEFAIPVVAERLVDSAGEAAAAAEELGFPLAAKLCGDAIAHKTERGLVRLNLGDGDAVCRATDELLAMTTPADGDVSVLLAPMVKGDRELIAGMNRDPQFGPTVLIGIGGIAAEALADVAVRLVPIEAADASQMLDDLSAQALLGSFRGEPPVNRDVVVTVLMGLSNMAIAHPEIRSVDLNPLIVCDGVPIAVDALVELDQ